MTERENLFLNPLFRFGMPAMSTALIVAIAFLLVDDTIVRTVMLLVGAVDVVVTPWVLKRVGQQERTGTEPRGM